MASSVLTSRTIRGITYNQGDSFVCASAASGNAGSEGDGNSAAALTVGSKYYFLGYAVSDDSNTTIKYPCKIGSSSSASSTIGWYTEAVFPYATYKITFNANGGSGAPSAQTKTHGTALTLSSTKPTRSGYTFVGWGTSASDTSKDYDAGDSYTANASDTLYAIWKKTITLTYNANGGSGAPSSQSATIYNSTTSNKFTLSSTKPTRTGYTFLGWSTSSTATSSSYAAGGSITLSSSDTLYAVWSINSYNVTINCNGGSGVNSRTYTVETATFSLSTPTRTGYTFSGWTGSNGTTAQKTVSISKGSTGDKSYTAQWSENALTVNYYSNYATAFAGSNTPLNTVDNNNVKVGEQLFYYDNTYDYGLTNYSQSSSALYMYKTGYTATGKWGTSTSGGTLLGQDDLLGSTGQEIAEYFGEDLKSGNVSINLYAQWAENKLTVNYYSNKANYGTLEGNALNVNGGTNVLVHSQEFLYDNKYDNGLSDVQNKTYLYLLRTGYKPTGYWGTSIDGGNLVNQSTPFATGQDLAVALGKTIANGNVSVNIYPQWKPSGVVYIDNGTKFEAYLPYIDNGTSWDLYLAYVDNGEDWDIIS